MSDLGQKEVTLEELCALTGLKESMCRKNLSLLRGMIAGPAATLSREEVDILIEARTMSQSRSDSGGLEGALRKVYQAKMVDQNLVGKRNALEQAKQVLKKSSSSDGMKKLLEVIRLYANADHGYAAAIEAKLQENANANVALNATLTEHNKRISELEKKLNAQEEKLERLKTKQHNAVEAAMRYSRKGFKTNN